MITTFTPSVQKEKSNPCHIPPQNVGKCEALTLNETWQPGAVKLKNANPQSQAKRSARTSIFKALPREGYHPRCIRASHFTGIQRHVMRGIGFIFYCYVFARLFLLKDQFPVQFVLEISP